MSAVQNPTDEPRPDPTIENQLQARKDMIKQIYRLSDPAISGSIFGSTFSPAQPPSPAAGAGQVTVAFGANPGASGAEAGSYQVMDYTLTLAGTGASSAVPSITYRPQPAWRASSMRMRERRRVRITLDLEVDADDAPFIDGQVLVAELGSEVSIEQSMDGPSIWSGRDSDPTMPGRLRTSLTIRAEGELVPSGEQPTSGQPTEGLPQVARPPAPPALPPAPPPDPDAPRRPRDVVWCAPAAD